MLATAQDFDVPKLGYSRGTGTIYATIAQACSGQGTYVSTYPDTPFTGTPAVAPAQSHKTIGYCGVPNITSVWQCPTGTKGIQYGKCRPECPQGQVWNYQEKKCDVPCETGQTGTLRIDVAYRSNTDTTSSSSLFGRRDVPSTSCDGTCQVSVGSYAGGCNLYGTTAPYIVSCSYNTTTTGQKCSTADSNEPLPPVPCPTGTAPGYVNGAGGCYPVSETTTTTTPPTTNPDGSTTTTTQTTNPDGTVTTTTETTNPDGSKTITITTGPGSTGGTGGGSQPGENPADGPTDQCAADPSACEQDGNGGPFTGPEGVLYERHDFGEDQPTFFLAMNDFVETMENTRIVKAITGFYDVGNLSATCPVWSATVPMLNTTVVIDHFCTPTAQLMLNIAWAVVQIAFAYAAFRIAFL